jgi:hypothetical protein
VHALLQGQPATFTYAQDRGDLRQKEGGVFDARHSHQEDPIWKRLQ